MTTVSTALQELGIQEWVLRGDPTDSAEFATMFSKVIGADDYVFKSYWRGCE